MLTASVLTAIAAAAATLLCTRQLRIAGRWWASLAGARTEADLARLFVFVSARQLLVLTLVFTTCIVALAAMAGLPPLVLGLLAVPMLAVPRLALRVLTRRWQRRLVGQLPEALTLWAGLLKAGQGAQHALAQVAQRQPAPLGQELRYILAQVRMGVTLDAGFAALRERVDLPDLRLLSTLLAAQRELGGNLAESLTRLAELLRARLAMEARIHSLTAQGRLQGVVVGVLPLLLMLVLYGMERDAMQVLHTTWQGWTALGMIALLEILGFVMIRRIVRIEV